MHTRADHVQLPAATPARRAEPPVFQLVDNRRAAVAQRHLHELANNSSQLRRMRQLQAISGASSGMPAAQLVKTRDQVKYAENVGEATRLMKAYAERLELEWAKLPPLLTNLTIEYAQDWKKGGIDGGEKLLFSEKQTIIDNAKKQERRETVQDDFDTINDNIGNDLAKAVFGVAHSVYVGGGGVNTGISGAYTQDQYYAAKREWDDIDNLDTVSNFYALAPQDKAKAGKANVGATLATRKVQGNMFCTFKNTQIDVHVDIA